jgi:hypothetical protein
VRFSPLSTARVRVILVPRAGSAVGLTELEAWGPAELPLAEPTSEPQSLAFRRSGAPYPRASASYTYSGDKVEQVHDLQVAFTRYSRNRWSAYQSPNARDWVEIDLGKPRTVSTIELYLYGDDRGLTAPRDYAIQFWNGTGWRDARVRSRSPSRPLASARNRVTIDPIRTSRLRVVLQHDRPAFSAMTEVVVR